ncbi:biliverdin-producing heme oxygenase [Rhodococcus sp. HNM0563]|uniref:biliverdin-producing heme oxygenase n=1 Tax=unclassified Rhodococcus (in: high G+C Gram-positive bacteria) TaxID=192944 RepID=UPI00146D6F8E|nr:MULTISPECIES: biliverdin-producing heme oxygenase [unclassified Rhodococcus (in: high G+C Gram-positive bacteria)]MCK0093122.1 biliverdin-producing heme oxygenase [Rhodococcus sp. F64268]NLU65103.1 biliverdin-producing heme oxygenase [Rhodococcus sp. HNM0563]
MTTTEVAGFSERIRIATQQAHSDTENSVFVTELLDGKLDASAHAALIAQTWFVYDALERIAHTYTDDPIVGPFLTAELLRTPALEADLGFLLGAQWRDGLTPLPATVAYVQRLDQVAASSPEAFLAHHYLRYMGDLSGGQIIRRMLERAYGYDRDGLRFYIFDDIPKPKPFKDSYRAKLDTAPLDEAQQQKVIDEANLAFGLNGALFADLAADLDRYRARV